jgi:cellulose synthase/poly-beta-1,6-N-acetylglucosamine synthase-like glycosyltransferase
MKVCILVLVVVYKTDPALSDSLRTLVANDYPRNQLRVIVWDNSPNSIANLEFLQKEGFEYYLTPENLSLSVIYNKVITKHLRGDEYLLLLDQDTLLPKDFLRVVESAVSKDSDIDLFLPMVRANNSWVSPINYLIGWGRSWGLPRSGRMRANNICAINSGMLIAAKYLKNEYPGYDERLRFYGTDTQFMLDYMSRRCELVVLDSVLEHDLSFFSGSASSRANKFYQMRSAYSYIYEDKSALQRTSLWLVMLIISLFYSVKYKDLKFLKFQSQRPSP